MPVCWPTQFVRYKKLDDFVVILNLYNGQYDILNAVASSIWELSLLKGSVGEISEILARDYDIEAAAAEIDVLRFLGDLEAKNVVARQPLTSFAKSASVARQQPVSRWCLLIAAAWYLWDTRRSLRLGRLATIYQTALARSLQMRSSQPRACGPARRAFATAEAVLVTEASESDCLPRSLALFRLLQASGVSCCHIIGVRLSPFEAHAWVTHDDKVLFDDVEYTRRFSEIARIDNA